MIADLCRESARLPRHFGAAFRVLQRLRQGRLDLVLDDGRRFRVQGRAPGPSAQLHVHDPDLFARLIREGDLGFCEAYLDGGWSSPDLQALMDLLHAGNDRIYDGFPGLGLLRTAERLRHRLRGNSRAQARRNIAAHYDLGNDFYALWLDPGLTYSAALYETGGETLDEAQRAKYRRLLDRIGARPGDHLLEIGCGWGAFAELAAAERGLRVTGLTISPAQQAHARRRIAAAGLADRVEIRLCDYRDATGRYDAIASIEMFEAVGERYWPLYFQTLRERLKPGGRVGLQVITVREDRWETYRRGVDFIRKHVFPGGMLPSPGALRAQIDRAGFRIVDERRFGQGYSRTLREWHARFEDNWDRIAAQGFDERFRRLWTLYLTASAGSFAGGNTDVAQITLE